MLQMEAMFVKTEQKPTLLKRVAESTVIFFPMFQLGCFRASATLTSFNFSTGKSLSSTVLSVSLHNMISKTIKYRKL